MNAEYEEYVKKRWRFSNKLAKELVDNEQLQATLSIEIFSKSCSPLYYFQEDNDGDEEVSQPPSARHIKYARDLKIENPEQYTKNELSKKIDEVLNERKGEHD